MKKIIEVTPAPFAAVEMKPGQFVAVRVSHKSYNPATGNTTTVYEGVGKGGVIVKGTKAQILKQTSPVATLRAAKDRATKANAEPALV